MAIEPGASLRDPDYIIVKTKELSFNLAKKSRGDIMTTQYWREFLIPYQQAVDEIVLKFNNMKNQALSLGENSPIESVRGRVKTISSILEKMNKYDFQMEEVEKKMLDIAGVRIICQFADDIYEVVNIIEARSKLDMEIVQVKNYMEGPDKSVVQAGDGNPKSSGYQSYHLIIRYPVYCATGYKDVFVEIQIRTLAMNFWSVIEHSLNYKYKEKVPEEIQKRLQKAADAVIGLDLEMSEIRKESQSAQRLFKMKSSTVNDIIDNIDTLYKLSKSSKAAVYERIFDEMSNVEDIVQLILLKKELDAEISKIKEEMKVTESIRSRRINEK